MSALTAAVLRLAATQVGVRELGRNRGERVQQYQDRAGAHPGDPWCACFVSWCFAVASNGLALPCPFKLTFRALELWRKSPVEIRSSWPTPGSIFVVDHGAGLGHCGLVESFSEGDLIIVTIEGNTSPGGSREGDGVYRRTRPLDEINLGYVDYGREPGAELVD